MEPHRGALMSKGPVWPPHCHAASPFLATLIENNVSFHISMGLLKCHAVSRTILLYFSSNALQNVLL